LLQENFSIKILFCNHYFSPHNIFMRKGKDPDPYLDLSSVVDMDPVDPQLIGLMDLDQ
jgi:hypothetical protein